MGIASLVLGIVSIVIGFIPIIGLICFITALIGFILGIISLVKKNNKGMSISGIVLCVLAIIVIYSSTDSFLGNTTSSPDISSTQVSNNRQYAVGETFKNNLLAITYISVNDNFTNYNKYVEIKDGYKVIQASFEFENVGTSDKLASSYDFNCYADGYDCNSFWSVDDSFFNSTLSSGKKCKGNVYFEVPTNANEITLEYELNAWTSEKVTFKVK